MLWERSTTGFFPTWAALTTGDAVPLTAIAAGAVTNEVKRMARNQKRFERNMSDAPCATETQPT
jgi:hypothetical protein